MNEAIVHLGFDAEEHSAVCGSTDAPIVMGASHVTCAACLRAALRAAEDRIRQLEEWDANRAKREFREGDS